MRAVLRTLLMLSLSAILVGCQTLDSTDYGVRFWKLPPALGGGVSSKVYNPGETYLVIPWLSEFYVYDSSVQSIRWGSGEVVDESDERRIGDSHLQRAGYLQTRAADGNEVALAMTVSYRFLPDSQRLPDLVPLVGPGNEQVRRIVVAAARSDVRSYMNRIRTSEFISNEARYPAVDGVRKALSERLAPFGIEVVRVNLDDFKFWRELPDGGIDSSYEDILKLIQQRQEDVRREEARYETLKQEKERELTTAQAHYVSALESAKGYRQQMTERGDSYLLVKQNEAEAARQTGAMQAQAIREAVDALSGPGGQALLRLRLAEELLKAGPRFVLLQGSGKQTLTVERQEVNELLQQLGLFEGISKREKVRSIEVPNSATVE